MSKESYPNCAECGILACLSGLEEKTPDDCPMLKSSELLQQNASEYKKQEIKNLACSAAKVEAEGYCEWTRVEEIINYARKLGFKRIGLAYCIGLRREAKKFTTILKNSGFEVVSVACKTGSAPKEELGLADSDKVKPGNFEAMCNPVSQAALLNQAEAELKVILGLCVGHDSLFLQYAKPPVTVLAVKDRVLAHNPLGAIYAEHYFKSRF